MRRLLLGTVVLVLVLGVAGIAYLYLSIDGIVARAIEREGSRVVGAPVSVGWVDLDIRQGVGTVHGLRVGNPEGFGGDAFAFDEIELEIATRSLREQPFRLSRVRIDDATVHLEIDEQGRTNLERLAQNTRERPARDPDAEPGEPRRIAIAKLDFGGGTLVVDRPGAPEPERLELLSFDESGIGGANGATGGEIAKLLTQTLVRQVAASTAAREVERMVERELGGAVGEAAGSIVKELLRD